MFRFLRFRRSAPKPAPDRPPAPLNTIEGLAGYLQDRLSRSQDLISARRGASVSELAAIDEEIDQLCREMAEDVEKFRLEPVNLSKRLQRMLRLTLDEICEQRDKSRQLRQPHSDRVDS
jgi:hypothetical protein